MTEAQEVLDGLRPVIEQLIAVRADTAELSASLQRGESSALGGLAELKGFQARLDELTSELTADGMQVKGLAPMLLDFPAEWQGEQVLLCWLEDEPRLGWYHRVEAGFAGRRPLVGDS